MLTLKDKLRSLDRKTVSTATTDGTRTLQFDFDSIGLSKLSNACGEYVVREKKYPLDFAHGGCTLAKCLSASHRALQHISKNYIKEPVAIKDFIFFDSETTGLAGGSGTYAFLCGFGFFEREEFIVRQFLLPSFDNEAAYLNQINDLLQDYKGLISFNGKSYDLPLLRTRSVINKIDSLLDDFIHIDLLYASRRLWRKKIQDCSLGNIERQILGFARQNDVQGAQIPKLFFDYIKAGDAGLLLPVFKHNVIDILSMVSLISLMADIFCDAGSGNFHQEVDDLALVKNLVFFNEYSALVNVLKNAAVSGNTKVVSEIAGFLKRTNRIKEAVPLWEKLLSSSDFIEAAYLELAKYYEHKQLDYSKALDVTSRVIKRFEIRSELGRLDEADSNEDWYYRQNRLIKKIKKYSG